MANNTGEKIAALEAKHEYIIKTLDTQTETLNETNDKVNQIKSRLDTWNGTLPHVKTGLEQLTSEFRDFRDAFAVTRIDDVRDYTISKTRLKIIWGILTTVLLVVLTASVKFLFN